MIPYTLIVALYFSSFGPVMYRATEFPDRIACLAAKEQVRIEMPKAASHNTGVVIVECVPTTQAKKR